MARAKKLGKREMIQAAQSEVGQQVRYNLIDPDGRWKASFDRIGSTGYQINFKQTTATAKEGALRGYVRYRLEYDTYQEDEDYNKFVTVEVVYTKLLKVACMVYHDGEWVQVKRLQFLSPLENNKVVDCYAGDNRPSGRDVLEYIKSDLERKPFVGKDGYAPVKI